MEFLPSIRASDSDREQVAERLRHATSEGRLTGDELDERLGILYAARTYGELDTLVADLPVARPQRQRDLRIRPWVAATGVVTLLVGVIGILALTRGRSAAAVVGGGHLRRFYLPGPLAGPHHGLVLAASTGAALMALLVCAALIWGLLRSRPTRVP
jgi:hypothetical protein